MCSTRSPVLPSTAGVARVRASRIGCSTRTNYVSWAGAEVKLVGSPQRDRAVRRQHARSRSRDTESWDRLLGRCSSVGHLLAVVEAVGRSSGAGAGAFRPAWSALGPISAGVGDGPWRSGQSTCGSDEFDAVERSRRAHAPTRTRSGTPSGAEIAETLSDLLDQIEELLAEVRVRVTEAGDDE